MRALAALALVHLILVPHPVHAQAATVQGVVVDDAGGPLPGAIVVLRTAQGGNPGEATTGPTGAFTFADVPSGAATLHVELAGFQPRDVEVDVGSIPDGRVTIRLQIGFDEEVTVTAEESGGVLAPSRNADAIEFDPESIRRLPTDAEDLHAIVDAFTAGSPTGGASVVVDGVETSGASVPAAAIHRIVVNRNPYSVEYQSPGKARVEVETERGSRRFYHGSAALFFRNSALQARNAFAAAKPDLTRAMNEAAFSGPFFGRAWSFFVTGQHLIDDDTAIVNAWTLDGPVSQNVAAPERRATALGRVDYRPNRTDALTFRYDLFDDSEHSRGVGGFRLAEQAYATAERRHRVQVNDHRVAAGGVLNDLRFEAVATRQDDGALPPSPALVVEGAFAGGPSQVFSRTRSTTLQVQDAAAFTVAAHPVRIGARIKTRRSHVTDGTDVGGTYRFQSLADLLAGRPFVFSRRSAASAVAFTDNDADAFVETTFRPASSVAVTAGARYDLESQLSDWNNVAPRVSVAFAPANTGLVFRGGGGVFYQSLPQEAVARTLLFGDGRQGETSIANPSFPNPPMDAIERAPRARWRLAPSLEVPRTLQASAGIEETIGRRSSIAVEYLRLRTAHAFRSRDVNAAQPGGAQRPDPSLLNVFEIDSTGDSRTDALTATLRGRVAGFKGTAQYVLSKTTDDASGIFQVPADSVTLIGERGRADFDRRHRGNVAGTYGWKRDRVRLGGVLALTSGAPFDILTGADTNGDLVTNDRPAGVPRNSGNGPAFAELDLRLTVVFRAPRPPSQDPESLKREQVDNLELTIDLFNALDRV
ncbi:MAG TPA: carboxypeptidase regulatory-like domain-containing protein, partial [Vicinamibacterales bacterium]|nr:carboxypeptidase regulatory-like domain-containing protein [Vicinamibacterales bacterium]